MPRNESASDKQDEMIQNLKQNMEVMNQMYKNFYSVSSKWRFADLLWQPYIWCELFVEKEVITFNLAVPKEYSETFEKKKSEIGFENKKRI